MHQPSIAIQASANPRKQQPLNFPGNAAEHEGAPQDAKDAFEKELQTAHEVRLEEFDDRIAKFCKEIANFLTQAPSKATYSRDDDTDNAVGNASCSTAMSSKNPANSNAMAGKPNDSSKSVGKPSQDACFNNNNATKGTPASNETTNKTPDSRYVYDSVTYETLFLYRNIS